MEFKKKLGEMETTLKTMGKIFKDDNISDELIPHGKFKTFGDVKSDTIGELLKHKKIISGEKIFFKDSFPDKITSYFIATVTVETRKMAVVWVYDGKHYSPSKLTQMIKGISTPLNGTMYWVNKDGKNLYMRLSIEH